MIVFKYYFNLLKKNLFLVLIYTIIGLAIGILIARDTIKNKQYEDKKPVIAINNYDQGFLGQNIYNYFKEEATFKKVKDVKEAIYYADISYYLEIPKDYTKNKLNNKEALLIIQKNNDDAARLMDNKLKNYLKLEEYLLHSDIKKDDYLSYIKASITDDIKAEVVQKANRYPLKDYFCFISYSIMVTILMVITSIKSFFNKEEVKRRILISKMDYREYNLYMLLASIIFSFCYYLLYLIVISIFFSNLMFTRIGLLYAFNLLMFTAASTSLALLISELNLGTNAINIITNTLSLGLAFISGAFVPREFLDPKVLSLSKISPNYYYIENNALIADDLSIGKNTLYIFLFIILFMVLTNIVSRKTRKFQ